LSSMEAAVNGRGGNGVFATATDADDGMVAAALTTAAQLMTRTAIAAATIGQRHRCYRCHCIIVPPSHCCLCQQQLPSIKTTIAAPPSTATSVNNYCHYRHQGQSTTPGFWRPSLLTVWQRQWGSLPAGIVVVVNGFGGGIVPTALMAALLMVALVDGGGNDGVALSALALPWTRIGWRGGGCAVTRLIHCCHGRCHWRHLCLHSRDNGAKDNGHGNR
jgi:hypothetical protein